MTSSTPSAHAVVSDTAVWQNGSRWEGERYVLAHTKDSVNLPVNLEFYHRYHCAERRTVYHGDRVVEDWTVGGPDHLAFSLPIQP